MASALAHELNQPLTAIMNYVKAATRTMSALEGSAGGEGPRVDGQGDRTRPRAQARSSGTCASFIEKRESSRTYENVNKVVEEAIALGLVGSADANVRVHLELDPAVTPILIDKVQIQQVLINLIRNSIEAMQSVTRRELTIQTSTDSDGSIEVAVSDTGPGLSEEVAAACFSLSSPRRRRAWALG